MTDLYNIIFDNLFLIIAVYFAIKVVKWIIIYEIIISAIKKGIESAKITISSDGTAAKE